MMKQLLLILSILLTCTAAQAQRYRLVADSTFSYNRDIGKYSLASSHKYVYNPENNYGSVFNVDSVWCDTLYSFEYNNDGRLNEGRLHYEVRKYDSSGHLVKASTYEVNSDSTYLSKELVVNYDAQGLLVSKAEYLFTYSNLEYNRDSLQYDFHSETLTKELLLLGADTLEYNDEGLLVEHREYSNHQIYMWDNDLSFAKEDCYMELSKVTQYEYRKGNMVVEEEQYKLLGYSYRNVYGYRKYRAAAVSVKVYYKKKDGRYPRRWLEMQKLKRKNRHREVLVTKERCDKNVNTRPCFVSKAEYNRDNNKRLVWGKRVIKTTSGVYIDRLCSHYKNDKDIGYTILTYKKGEDGFEQTENVKDYNADGYLLVETETHSDGDKQTRGSKHTYTYEQY